MSENEKQNGAGARQRRQFSTEQKLAILQQWHEGTPVAHICRQHALNSKGFYRWKKQLDKGLSDRAPGRDGAQGQGGAARTAHRGARTRPGAQEPGGGHF